MRPLILNFQEKTRSFPLTSNLGTNTFTEARENKDNDFENQGVILGRKTMTATRENIDDAPLWS